MLTSLGLKIFLWGIFLMAQGASQNYGDMVGLRFVSGMFEAVADPCFGKLSVYNPLTND